MATPNWKFVQHVCVYTYQPDEDDVIIQLGSLMRAELNSSLINVPIFRLVVTKGKCPAASPEPGVMLDHTFWLKKRDDEKAYQIIRNYKQTKVTGSEKISFAELDKLYGYKQ